MVSNCIQEILVGMEQLLYGRDPGGYEKERDKNTKMKAIIAKLEAESQAWRSV